MILLGHMIYVGQIKKGKKMYILTLENNEIPDEVEDLIWQ
jgi:hypothetical protein